MLAAIYSACVVHQTANILNFLSALWVVKNVDEIRLLGNDRRKGLGVNREC